jgi:hypothetical protein
MSIGGAAAAGHEPDKAAHTVPPTGSKAALAALLAHIATELAVEYIDRMEEAANKSSRQGTQT